jgi:hypothetical protein
MLSNAALIAQYEARRPRRAPRRGRSPQFPGRKSPAAPSFPPTLPPAINGAAFPSPIAAAPASPPQFAPAAAPSRFPTLLSGSPAAAVPDFPSMIGAPAFVPQAPPSPAAGRAQLTAVEAERAALASAVAARAARIQELEARLCELFEAVYRLEGGDAGGGVG